MQRDRLDGWMVRQIEHADLAKETVIQLPASSFSKKTSDLRSPRSAVGSPRRRFLGHTAVQRPHTTPQAPSLALDSGRTPRTRLETAAAVVGELDGEDSIARQWRLRFQHPGQSFAEDGHVNRSQVLKSPRRPEAIALDWGDCDDDDQDGYGDATRESSSPSSSPLTLWGMPREYILEYIRQSVMPTSWTTHARFTGEWEAVPPSAADGRYAAKSSHSEEPFESSALPPLAARHKSHQNDARAPTSPLRSARAAATPSALSPRASTSPSRATYRRPHPGASSIATPTSPRFKPPRCEERILRVLAELRSDPKAWAAFQKDVKRFIDDQRKKQHQSSRARESTNSPIVSPRAPELQAERKRRNDERLSRVQHHRTLLIQQEDDKLEAKLQAYRRKVQACSLKNGGTDGDTGSSVDVTTTVRYRRRKMWLLAVAIALSTSQLHQRLVQERQRQVLRKMETQAARVIQNLWKKWKWRHASKQTIVIYAWLRKCLWKLLLKMRCRRKHRLATLLQKFMIDQLSGSRETRNFNRMMLKWRGKVILSQRSGVGFVSCSRARLLALSLWWDALDHDRQRSERQLIDRFTPTTDEKEAEWNAIVNNRGRSLLRRPSIMNGSTRSLLGGGGSGSISISSTASTTASTATSTPPPTTGQSGPAAVVSTLGGSGSTTQLSTSGSASSLSRRSVSTRQLVDQMDERLTTMQQVLTPFEIQRLQQHAFHVVKIPKAIKMRLLQELLTSTRKEYMRQLTVYHDQVACASYSREVKLDDARAIVQSGASWGSLLVDSRTGQAKLRRPIFQLYSGDKQKRLMEELVKRGVQLTLESDPEQRAIVERQRLQRQSLEAGSLPLNGSAGGSGPGSLMGGSRKRESNTVFKGVMATPQPPLSTGTGSGTGTGRDDGGSGRKTARKLTFAIPATIKEKPKK